MRRLALLGLLALPTLSCASEKGPPPTPAFDATSVAPSRATPPPAMPQPAAATPSPGCRVLATRDIATALGRLFPGSLAVRYAAPHHLVAVGQKDQPLAVYALGPDLSPLFEPKDVSLPSAHKLCGLWPMGSGVAVASHDLCLEKRFFHKCLFLVPLDQSGKPQGEPTSIDVEEWMSCSSAVPHEGSVLLALDRMYAPDELLRLSLVGTDLRSETLWKDATESAEEDLASRELKRRFPKAEAAHQSRPRLVLDKKRLSLERDGQEPLDLGEARASRRDAPPFALSTAGGGALVAWGDYDGAVWRIRAAALECTEGL